ncbi:toll/interleukin-1 receptor domain-containing protein [Natrarchaeobius halalkaliphilus]|uniref:Toll/interleukin-1 receptor domain-containing protein n=1 Tax=Natrarchaeobius halalkaliphilus TaxID=1679091 RepID=A0A3N6M2G6_9EURY|nr:toll/interleukin-1 receptor domain-containing protein [Natrarchaeobius halalkaliphilus]RQG90000.1 toll/interleukin-1 receptor domain-containing protein [Natrarchaeobius halalkaliphilus]
MTGEQVYVSHAPGDLEFVQELLSTVRNFPFGIHIALEEVESNSMRARLEGRLVESDVVVAVLTEQASRSRWVNQELGYARSQEVSILPVFDDERYRGGFISDLEGVQIDRERPAKTIFELLSRLRCELEPLGPLSVPNWFIQFPCPSSHCPERVTLDIERSQSKLWNRHRRGHVLTASCDHCRATYSFDPATIGFVRRDERGQ